MLRVILTALLLLAVACPAAAEYPERALTILTGYPPGGMVDIVSRALAEPLKKKFPKNRILPNLPHQPNNRTNRPIGKIGGLA